MKKLVKESTVFIFRKHVDSMAPDYHIVAENMAEALQVYYQVETLGPYEVIAASKVLQFE